MAKRVEFDIENDPEIVMWEREINNAKKAVLSAMDDYEQAVRAYVERYRVACIEKTKEMYN